jgi:hypothetical protein
VSASAQWLKNLTLIDDLLVITAHPASGAPGATLSVSLSRPDGSTPFDYAVGFTAGLQLGSNTSGIPLFEVAGSLVSSGTSTCGATAFELGASVSHGPSISARHPTHACPADDSARLAAVVSALNAGWLSRQAAHGHHVRPRCRGCRSLRCAACWPSARRVPGSAWRPCTGLSLAVG